MKERHMRAVEAGVLAALLAAAVLCWTLFCSPALVVASDGTYEAAMVNLGLVWDGEAIAPGEVVTHLQWTERFDIASVVRSGQHAMVLPVTLIRVCTQPFGIAFETWMLAAVYIVMMALGVYLAVSGLYRHSALGAAAAGCAAAVLCAHTGIMGYLNSLYSMGAAIAFTFLFVGTAVRCFCGRHKGFMPVVLTALTGALMLQSQPQMIVFAPAVLLTLILLARHTWPGKGRRLIQLLACLLAAVMCMSSAWTAFINDPDVSSDAADYLAVFQGYLPTAEEPQAVLEGLRLDDTYLQDTGRSYYDPDELFAHNPRIEASAELHEKLAVGRRMLLCLKTPSLVFNRIDSLKTSLYDALSERVLTTDGDARYTKPSAFMLLNTMFGEGGFASMTGRMLFALAMVLLLTALCFRSRMVRLAGCCAAAFLLCAMAYLPVSVALTGAVDINLVKPVFFFFGWLSLLSGAVLALMAGQRLLDLLSVHPMDAPEAAELTADRRLRTHRRPRISRPVLLGVTAFSCAALIVWLLFSPVHIGGVNNGDYGRMMEHLDLWWMPEQLEHQETQAGQFVIEEYSYREGMNLAKLTPADPSYSLIYPSAAVRLWSAMTGAPYSTQLQALVLLIMTCAALLLILYDLYPLLGQWTVIAAAALVCMLMGENYLAWYNSLFGEASISTGLMMTIACSLHLTCMERGKRSSWVWLILLALSIRFMVCAKAQMLLALPFGLLLLVVFAFYHHPIPKVRLMAWSALAVFLAGGVSYDALGVYRSNAAVSEEATVWQSVFYGLLMVADDPGAVMDELGIDRAMEPDIGKHAYYPAEDYVYAPASAEAKAGFYDKVGTMQVTLYYLKHPKYLIQMLEYASTQSVRLHTGFMAYTGDNYAENDDQLGPYRFSIWRQLRTWTASGNFWGYVALYGTALVWCLRKLFAKGGKVTPRNKLLVLLWLCVMGIGALQYPLSVIGNGYADNNKQMYCFMLCHDLLVVSAACFICMKLRRRRLAAENNAEEVTEA